mmetsp:Transcript_47456/g.148441  ORF Transcript_47456/g.148441 Transcript_47456/m.148441 type:complete len:112 (+) Transcript_47456:323-658(+)
METFQDAHCNSSISLSAPSTRHIEIWQSFPISIHAITIPSVTDLIASARCLEGCLVPFQCFFLIIGDKLVSGTWNRSTHELSSLDFKLLSLEIYQASIEAYRMQLSAVQNI